MSERTIWLFLADKLGNEYGAAGLMGNLKAESGLISTNLQNSYQNALGFSDLTYTKAVDDGTYTNFEQDKAGYGLAQWTYWSRKRDLLNYARKSCRSLIGNGLYVVAGFNSASKGYRAVLHCIFSKNHQRICYRHYSGYRCVCNALREIIQHSEIRRVRKTGLRVYSVIKYEVRIFRVS
jgi:hypothetical protein